MSSEVYTVVTRLLSVLKLPNIAMYGLGIKDEEILDNYTN